MPIFPVSDGIDCYFNIKSSPKDNKYSPLQPTINGNIEIVFTDSVKRVTSFTYGLKGTALMYYHSIQMDYNVVSNSGAVIRSEIIKDKHTLFDLKHDFLDDSSPNNETTFNNNDKLKKNFNLSFPIDDPDCYLPSSCSDFGSFEEFQGTITIIYEVYVDITRKSSIFKRSKTEYFSIPLIYQSGSIYPELSTNIRSLEYSELQTFDNKIKKFCYDPTLHALIPNDMNQSHRKTRFIRQIWNSNYKMDNYNVLTKSIPLSIKMSVNQYIFISEPILPQLSIVLECDLKNIDIATNQSTDFVFNGQSTKLGYFKVESLEIQIHYKSKFKAKTYKFKVDQRQTLFKFEFSNIICDIKDFGYDKENSKFTNVLKGEFMSHPKAFNSIINLIGNSTIMCNGAVQDYFDNLSVFEFIWTISDGNAKNPMERKYLFHTEASPEILVGADHENGVPFYSEVDKDPLFVPPPAYTDDKK